MSTRSINITAGVWVRFPSWDQWRYVRAARHADSFVQYDATDGPAGGRFFGGFSPHDEPCSVVTVTPQAVPS